MREPWGLRAALARGRKGGRRRKLSPDDEAVARAMLKDATIPVAAIAKRLGVSRATFYAYFPGARRRALPSQEARPWSYPTCPSRANAVVYCSVDTNSPPVREARLRRGLL